MDSPTLSRYSPTQQRDINLVRLHLQVLTLSDLSASDGKTIRTNALSGIRELDHQLRKHWPRQEHVTTAQRRLWTRFISSNYLRYDKYWSHALGPTPTQRLHTPRSPSIAPTLTDQSPTVTANSLNEYLSRLPRWHQRLLSNLQQEATDTTVWKAFRSRRRVTIASDGGLKHQCRHFWMEDSGLHWHTAFSGSGPIGRSPLTLQPPLAQNWEG
jgi:hypothetical protein